MLFAGSSIAADSQALNIFLRCPGKTVLPDKWTNGACDPGQKSCSADGDNASQLLLLFALFSHGTDFA